MELYTTERDKFIIVGHIGAGKDYVANMMKDIFGLRYTPTIEYYYELFLKPIGLSMEDYLNDKDKYRQVVVDGLESYNKDNPCAFLNHVFETSDIYTGLRDDLTLKAIQKSDKYNITTIAINSTLPSVVTDRHLTIDLIYTDYVICNHGWLYNTIETLVNFAMKFNLREEERLRKYLVKEISNIKWSEQYTNNLLLIFDIVKLNDKVIDLSAIVETKNKKVIL